MSSEVQKGDDQRAAAILADGAIYAGIFADALDRSQETQSADSSHAASRDGSSDGFQAGVGNGSADQQASLDASAALGIDDGQSIRVAAGDLPDNGGAGTDLADLGLAGIDSPLTAAEHAFAVALPSAGEPPDASVTSDDDTRTEDSHNDTSADTLRDQAAPAPTAQDGPEPPAKPTQPGSQTAAAPADDVFDNLNNIATTIIDTAAINRPPSADNDSYATTVGTALHVDAAKGVLNGDIDADSFKFAAAVTSAPAHGQLALNPDGSFDYVPEPGFVGTDSFSYVASDALTHSNVATVSIEVKQVPAHHDVVLV